MFPIGDICKPEVRRIASELNLITAHRKILKVYASSAKSTYPSFYNKNSQPKRERYSSSNQTAKYSFATGLLPMIITVRKRLFTTSLRLMTYTLNGDAK